VLGGVAGGLPTAEGGGAQRSAPQGGDFPPFIIYLTNYRNCFNLFYALCASGMGNQRGSATLIPLDLVVV